MDIDMDIELVQRWVTALRSGKYKQARDQLHITDLTNADGSVTESSYCCLGVLCDISKAGKWSRDTYIMPNGLYLDQDFEGVYMDMDQPAGVALAARVQPLPFNMAKNLHERLINYNDIKKYSFNRIAYELERHFKLKAPAAFPPSYKNTPEVKQITRPLYDEKLDIIAEALKDWQDGKLKDLSTLIIINSIINPVDPTPDQIEMAKKWSFVVVPQNKLDSIPKE